jgi:hypothetical protein
VSNKYLVLGSVLLLSTSAMGGKPAKVNEHVCKSVNAKIDQVNSQLRAGYTVKRGEQLKEKLRDLKKQHRACRLKKFKVE